MDQQHYFTCPDKECPVVVFVDRVDQRADPARNNACPWDGHDLGEGVGVLIVKDF